MRVCPNEPVLFRAVGEVFLDDSRGLVLTLRSVRGRPDAVALVFDRRHVRLVRLGGRSPAGHTGPRSFEFRKPWSLQALSRRGLSRGLRCGSGGKEINPSAQAGVRAMRNVRFWPIADLAKVASANGFVDTEGDQNERHCHEHPARMRAACYPKVGDSGIKV